MSMPRKKVCVTVEARFIEWLDNEVKKLRFRNRSHAVEYAIAKLIESEKGV